MPIPNEGLLKVKNVLLLFVVFVVIGPVVMLSAVPISVIAIVSLWETPNAFCKLLLAAVKYKIRNIDRIAGIRKNLLPTTNLQLNRNLFGNVLQNTLKNSFYSYKHPPQARAGAKAGPAEPPDNISTPPTIIITPAINKIFFVLSSSRGSGI